MRAKWSVRAASLNFGEREVPLRKLGDEIYQCIFDHHNQNLKYPLGSSRDNTVGTAGIHACLTSRKTSSEAFGG